MSELFNVRRPNGKLCAQCHTRDHAEREIVWQEKSGASGPFSIERIERESDYEYGAGYPRRFGGRWPDAKTEEFRARYGSGERLQDIVEYFGTNIAVACRMARRLGFGLRIDDPKNFERHSGRWTEREEQLVNFMYDEGVGTTKIPEHHPRTRKAVEARLRLTAAELSTRSKFGRFIAKGTPGRKRKTIHRVLEETCVDYFDEQQSGDENCKACPKVRTGS